MGPYFFYRRPATLSGTLPTGGGKFTGWGVLRPLSSEDVVFVFLFVVQVVKFGCLASLLAAPEWTSRLFVAACVPKHIAITRACVPLGVGIQV